MAIDDKSYQNIQLILKDWEISLKTQMHFNELLMKNRRVGLTIVGTFRSIPIGVLTISLTLAWFVAVAGLLMLICFIYLDFAYYRKLLLGAVEHTRQLDDFFSQKELQLEINDKKINLLGLTTKITEKVGDNPREDKNKYKKSGKILAVYYIPMIIYCILVLIYLTFFHDKSIEAILKLVNF